jgi:hypothetical protein
LREQLNTFRGVIADPTLPQGMMHGDIFPDNGTVRHQHGPNVAMRRLVSVS